MGIGHDHSKSNVLESHEPRWASLVKLATLASVSTAAVIICIKVIAYLMTDSVTMLASLVDSLLDIATSIVNFVAVRLALRPASSKYRFGFTRAEDLAVFAQSAFFGVSGIFLMVESIKRLLYPQEVENGLVGIGAMIFAIILTIGLVSFQRHVIKKTKSMVIKADYLHYVVDLASNVAVILSLVIVYFFEIHIVDALFGFGIAVYIFGGAWQLFVRALKNLLDQEINIEEKQAITDIIMMHPEVNEVHDFKSRYAGSKLFLQFHIELDAEMPLLKAHLICDEIEQQILEKFPNADILIHKDPKGHPHSKNFTGI